MVKPHFPDIIEQVVSRVDESFANRETDPFNVFFDKGILPQVRRSVYKANGNFPLCWLVMKYDEIFGTSYGLHSEVNFQIVFAMPTDPAYTQQEREDISFKPRLLPICDQFIEELKRERWLANKPGDNPIKYSRNLLPYWTMGDVEGPDQPNLFKEKFIDAITINVSGLKIKAKNCAGTGYTSLDVDQYPISSRLLTFYDDIELIVGGPESYDPVHNETSVVIPFLIGKDYEVEQRAYGQLRQRREVEFIPNLEQGGFALQGGLKFNINDTYFVKIRPQYLP